MSMGQMLLVLLGLVLFSTMILSYYNILGSQVEMVEKNQLQKQALKIIDFRFQLIESEVISNSKNLQQIYTEYPDFTTAIDTLTLNNKPYIVYIKANKCNAKGENISGTAYYIRMDARVDVLATEKDTIKVGLIDNPISKVFGDIFGAGVI
jgi:hypothetical protein